MAKFDPQPTKNP